MPSTSSLPPEARHRVGVAALTLALVLGGCGEIEEPFDIDINSTEPLTGLPPCEDPPPPSDDPPVAGLVVPDGSIVTNVSPHGPLTGVNGYIPMTPIQIRIHYGERDDVNVLVLEDEVYEAEVLLASGAHRMYMKALAHCDEGSSFQAFVAPEVDAGGLPVPDGIPDQPPPGTG